MRDKGWENIYRANGNQEQAGIAVTVFDKKDIEYRKIFVAEEESIAILPDRLRWPWCIPGYQHFHAAWDFSW